MYLTELAEAGVLGVGDRVAEGGEIDVRVIPHLPVLMLQPLVPRQLLRLLEELLVLRRHGRPPPPPRAGSAEREALQPRALNSGRLGFRIRMAAFAGSLDRRGGWGRAWRPKGRGGEGKR